MTLEDRVGAAPAAYLREVARRLGDMLGDPLEGVWLVGSAALGDFDARRSDLDVQAVTSRRLPVAEREEIAAALARHAVACPVRGLELVLYAREDLARPDGPAFQLNLNTGPGMEHHVALDPDQEPRFWFVIDVSIAAQAGVPLAGPPASVALPEQPHALVVAALREALGWYADHGGSPAQTILAACRTWAWAADGRWLSKGDSARWARDRLRDPGPVDRALRLRDGTAKPALGRAEVDAVVGAARGALEAAMTPAAGSARRRPRRP
jgi:hypothetical protein